MSNRKVVNMATTIDNIMEQLKQSEEGEVFRTEHNATKWNNVEYEINGNLVSRNQFKTLKNGKLVKSGDYEIYQDGALFKSGTLKKGTPVEKEVVYFQDGTPKNVIHFNNKGELDGESKTFNQDGSVVSAVEYSKGKDIYKEWLKKNGVNNPESSMHFYDYRAAYEAGENVDSTGHWPSKYKHDNHPNRYIREGDGWYDTKYDKAATDEDVLMQSYARDEHLLEMQRIREWYDKSNMYGN